MIGRLGLVWKRAPALAWVLAYALVLQIVLTSSLLASQTLDPARDLHQLCLNAPSQSAPQDQGTTDRIAAFVHCPACLSRVDVAILPTPPAIRVLERRAVAVRFHLFEPSSAALSGDRVAHRPRGPPVPA